LGQLEQSCAAEFPHPEREAITTIKAICDSNPVRIVWNVVMLSYPPTGILEFESAG